MIADNNLCYRLAEYVLVLVAVVLVWGRIELVTGNGGRKPLRYILLALLLSNVDLLVASVLKYTVWSEYSVWVFFVTGILTLMVLIAFVRYRRG